MINETDFKGRHFISMRDFTRNEIEYILEISDNMMELEAKGTDLAKGKIMGTLFFEPSTRTRLSFEASMLRLGGGVTGFADPGISSLKKGESMEDTIRTIQNYVDIIVMRHPDEWSSRKAAKISEIPIINGGSGAWEHPTQALLDLHTIKHAKNKISGLTIGLCGDLLYGRTVHSLMIALSKYADIKLYLISPEGLKMRNDVIDDTKDMIEYVETESLINIVAELDVLYMTRIQKERFTTEKEYKKYKGTYLIDKELLNHAKKDVILMHPLPRVDEINSAVDYLPNAWYFKQVRHGIYVRMAIISLTLGLI